MKRALTISALVAIIIAVSASIALGEKATGKAGCGKTTLVMTPSVGVSWCKPAQIASNTPAIILIQDNEGSDRNWNGNLGETLANDFVRQGVVTFRFDMPKADSSVIPEAILAAAKVIETAPVLRIPARRIFLFGYGKGAKYAVAAANIQRKSGKHFGGIIIAETKPNEIEVTALNAVREPAMVARGTGSNRVSEDDIIAIKNLLGSKNRTRLTQIQGMDHGLNSADNKLSFTFVDAVQDWTKDSAR